MLNELANFSRRVEPTSSSMTCSSNTAFTPSPPFFMIFGWIPWPPLTRIFPERIHGQAVHGGSMGPWRGACTPRGRWPSRSIRMRDIS